MTQQIHEKDAVPQGMKERDSRATAQRIDNPVAETARSVIACGSFAFLTSGMDSAFSARYQPVSAPFAANLAQAAAIPMSFSG